MAFLLGTPPADRHSTFEDLQGLLTGTLLMALSVQFFEAGSLITGQVAGLSLLVSYWSGWSFGAVFFLINLPFYVVGYMRMGLIFTLKTFAAVGILIGWTVLLPLGLSFEFLHPLAAAILGGVTSGAGLLILFRHGATLGGVGIVALWLQDTKGIKAGKVQLGFDIFVFALAIALFSPMTVVFSLLSAVVTNLVILTNHRRDRYIAR